MHRVVDVRVGRDLRFGAGRDAAAELAAFLRSAVEVDARGVQFLCAVTAEAALGRHLHADRNRLLAPVLRAVAGQIAGRQQCPHFGLAVRQLHRDVVADVRVLPPDTRDLAFDLAREARVEFARERVV